MTAAKTQVLDQVDAQLRAINEQLDVLREFNRKVDRLEQTGFWRRYENLTPNVVMKMNDMKFEPTGATSFAMMGRVESWLEEFDQDEIDAFVLTFRLFTQDNEQVDRLGAADCPNRKSVSSTHMRCMMIASFRATATHAFLAPMRLASFTPHARSTDHFRDLRRCAFASSKIS